MAKGVPATEKQKAAGKRNLQAAHRARRQRAIDRLDEKPRWAMVLDGELKVRDLTDEELNRGAIMNNDGTWEGPRKHLPPRILNRMSAERARRIRTLVNGTGMPAARGLGEIIDDPDHSARFQAIRLALEYNIGKVPDVVHLGVESEWDRMQQAAFVIQRGVDAVSVDDDHVVAGEVLSVDEEEQG